MSANPNYEPPITMSHADWMAEARRRFGDDANAWRFVCPACYHVASVKDWKDAGAPEGAVAFSCVGRYLPDAKGAADRAFKRNGGPCNYTLGGLFVLEHVIVDIADKVRPTFAFADLVPAQGTPTDGSLT